MQVNGQVEIGDRGGHLPHLFKHHLIGVCRFGRKDRDSKEKKETEKV